MGFNIQSLTQAVVNGEFNVVTNDPIPLIEYGDSYSWAKYGHHILHRGILPIGGLVESTAKHDSNLTATHRDSLIQFLRIHPDEAASHILDKESEKKIHGFLDGIFQNNKRMEKSYAFNKYFDHHPDKACGEVFDIALGATKIPFSIFTDLFNHRFKKKPYLESTLEILQQFYIELTDYIPRYCQYIGDCHLYCVKCSRCHLPVTSPQLIYNTPLEAPIAMLYHWGFNIQDESYEHNPVLFSSKVVYKDQLNMFTDNMALYFQDFPKNENVNDTPYALCRYSSNSGAIRFCESVKVDLQSWFNSMNKQRNSHNVVISSTYSLVCVCLNLL